MTKKEKSEYIIQSVVHALDLLEQFHGDVDEFGVTELSQRLRIHKNNVFRLLATLESRQFIEQNRSTSNYRLGLKNLELGQAVIRQLGLHRQAGPVLERLARESRETASVSVLQEAQVIELDAAESTLPVRVASRVGLRLPSHCTAAGKVLLAALPAGKVHHHTSLKAADAGATAEELEEIIRQGYAVEDEDLDAGVRGIAAPVRDYSGRVVGAIAVTGPTPRFPVERMRGELASLVVQAARELSCRLGYHDAG
jgi:DNA-binding IclR family transcriptional regulator